MEESEVLPPEETAGEVVRTLLGVILSLLLAAGMTMFMGLMTGFASDSGPNPMYYFFLAYTYSLVPVTLLCTVIGLWKRSRRFLIAGFVYAGSPLLLFVAIGILLGFLMILASLFS